MKMVPGAELCMFLFMGLQIAADVTASSHQYNIQNAHEEQTVSDSLLDFSQPLALQAETTKNAVGTYQLKFTFPRNLQCINDFSNDIASLQQVLSSVQHRINGGDEAPTSAFQLETTSNPSSLAQNGTSTRKHTPRNVQSHHDSVFRRFQSSNQIRDQSSRNFHRFRQAGSEASRTLRDLSEEMQVMMTNLEIQIDEDDSRRRKLQLRNINLTRQLHHKINVITNITQQKDLLEKRSKTLQAALVTLQQENTLLQQNNQLLTQQKATLEEEKLLVQKSFQTLSSENKRIENEKLQLQSQLDSLKAEKSNDQENCHNVTVQVREMRNAMKRLQFKHNAKQRCAHGNQVLSLRGPKEVPNYTHCGVLVNVSEPETMRQSRKPILNRAGVWMKDPLATGEARNKIWTINQSGVKVRKLGKTEMSHEGTVVEKTVELSGLFYSTYITKGEGAAYHYSPQKWPLLMIHQSLLTIHELYQFANMTSFQEHRSEMVYLLPVSMESNGAVVYNGSFYFQRRNSRRIVRYKLATRKLVMDRSVQQAGFHGMFAYQWGGFTDIDFAVDETGLWVIYSTPRSRGNIVVSKIHPETLEILKTIRTRIMKRKVANAFIICQVLYTVSGFGSAFSSINYSFDLRNRTLKKLNMPFLNNYQFNTMIDYNPTDRFIYSWDNGRQVRYQATLDQSLGRIQEHQNSPDPED